MGLLSAIGAGIGLLGASNNANRQRNLEKKLQKELKKNPTPLAIPNAYKELMGSVNDEYLQAGEAQTNEITRQFQQNFAKLLGQLQMRGLGSSNLTANLFSGHEKRKAEAIANARMGLLGQRLGAQQNIGLQGLNTVANERAGQMGIRGNILSQIAQPALIPQGSGNADVLKAGLSLLSTAAPV